MRSKNILSIVVFVAAFGVSAAVASLFIGKNLNPTYVAADYSAAQNSFCKYRRSATASAINQFLAADEANGSSRDGEVYDLGEGFPPNVNSVSFADYAEATSRYVSDSSSMDAENLPADFQMAWHAHMTAWSDYSEFLNQTADISNQKDSDSENFSQADAAHSREINRTWTNVLRIGRNYGANVR